jgi:hypothetical protein
VHYAGNLNMDDGAQSVINISNNGAASTPSAIPNGDICVNVYAFSPDEQMVSCCSCTVTPNALVNLSVKRDLMSTSLTPILASAAVVQLVASRSSGSTVCDAGTTTPDQLSEGLEAWGTSLHVLSLNRASSPVTYGLGETPFSKASLTAGQLSRLVQVCAFLRANGSGYGVCKSCREGGLGASSK